MADSPISKFLSDPWRISVVVLSAALVTIIVVAAFVMADDAEVTTSTTELAVGVESTTTLSPVTTVRGATTTSGGDDNAVHQLLATNGLVAVKVDNATGARPQVGLADLPLLIEYPAEGGVTRMIALFGEESSGHVGPIRSLRPVDADLLSLFAPIAVSTGGRPFVKQAVEATGVIGVEPGALGVFDLGDRESPHNFFLDIDELLPRLAGYQTTLGGLPSGALPPGSKASTVAFPIAGIGFQYSEGSYQRTQDSGPFEVVPTIGGQATTLVHDTLIVLFATERSAGYFDTNGVEVSTFDVIGGGELEVFNSGEHVAGTWARAGYDTAYVFKDAAGREFGVPDGRVYLAILPRDTKVTHQP